MPSVSLTDRTRSLLKARPRHMTYHQIAAQTGLEMAWLRSFGVGDSLDSQCNRVQRLWEFLTGRELETDYPISASHYSPTA